MDKACIERRLSSEASALEQDRQGGLDADEAREALRPPRAGKQTDERFRKPERGTRAVDENTVVRRERKLAAATKREAGNRRGHRLAGGLKRAEGSAQREEMVEGDREAFARRRRDDHVICNAEFGEIGPCAKGIVLEIGRAHV